MKRNIPPLTDHLFRHGTPAQLAPYMVPCPGPPTCHCKAMGHLTRSAQRQLLAEWERGDQQQERLRWLRAGLDLSLLTMTIRGLLWRFRRLDLIEDWMP